MEELRYTDGVYRTGRDEVSVLGRWMPSFTFWRQFILTVLRASAKAKGAKYDGAAWVHSSHEVLRELENVGVRVEISGIDNFKRLRGPCLFIANHMSMLETMVLPGIIHPLKEVTFIVKQSLLEYPVFKHIMRSRNPIAVGRTNPRDDLRAVMVGGRERLGAGTSIIVFPQTTRTTSFDPTQFNTIGIKLARRAHVPVVPVALLTDAWANGKIVKDFGRIRPGKGVYFAFGEPMRVRGTGREEHNRIIEFISAKLDEWAKGETPAASAAGG